ncbi:MAG: FAD-dependent oxidoreductase [Deltaproteobacteria bacterium]|nr:FAD-dependent oxidoreductase [Deltaproteobacteria bacterium]
MRESVAVIGGGVAGLTAAHFLQRRYDVALYEKSGRLGGNAYTYRTRAGDDVDIAVAAFGRAGYKTFYRLLASLAIETKMCAGSFMSFHDLDANDGLYLTPSLSGLIAQRFRIFREGRLGALRQAHLGIEKALTMLERGELKGRAMRDVVREIPEFAGDGRTILLCALCLMSSMSSDEILEAPAEFFFGKLATHNDVVSWKAVYSVRAVDGHTKNYIEALARPYRDRVVLNAEVVKVAREAGEVAVVFRRDEHRTFDHVVFACNADQALALLEAPTDDERRLLGAWRYKEGRVVVHDDIAHFPERSLMQAYTFLYRRKGDGIETSVNGSLWHEPGVPKSCRLVSSQHPNVPIRADRIELEAVLRTPIFDFKSFPTIAELPRLNGVGQSWYCGSHFGYGLHEDAVRSAVDVARGLGCAGV